MILKPHSETVNQKENEADKLALANSFDPASQVLHTVGLSRNGVTKGEQEKSELDIASVRKTFIDKGATLEQVAETATCVMKFGESDGAKIAAARMVATVHGALKELDGAHVPVFNINVVSSNPEKSIINLVMPKA